LLPEERAGGSTVFRWKEIFQIWLALVVRSVVAHKYQLLTLVFLLEIAATIFFAMHGLPLADIDPWPLKQHHG
jgi:hypothetical protein